MIKNVDMGGHIPTFQPEKKFKNRNFVRQNNTLTNFEQVQRNFEKVPKVSFVSPKIVKSTLLVYYGCFFGPYRSGGGGVKSQPFHIEL